VSANPHYRLRPFNSPRGGGTALLEEHRACGICFTFLGQTALEIATD
jgi:hypothetical protein